MVILQHNQNFKNMGKTVTKVIHVHLIFEKKDFYFGSISAVFDFLDEERVGVKKSTLLHAGLSDGSTLPTRKAIIRQSHLIRGGR